MTTIVSLYHSNTMKLIFRLLLLLLCCPSCATLAQTIEAVNEDSTRTVVFRTGQGVECELLLEKQTIQTRGILSSVDSVSFRLDFGGGYFTTIYLDKLTRMRRRAYSRRRGAAALAGMGTGLATSGPFMPGPALRPETLVAVGLSALAGLGLAVAATKPGFRRKDPSTFKGWTFAAQPGK
jgi:hypothetical protein